MEKHAQRHRSRMLIVASLLALMGLGLVFFDSSTSTQTFAQQGQSCANLLGWTPGNVADGQSVTGYKLTGATYTATCDQLAGKLTCNNGSFGANGNIYKYQTCTQPTRANCTFPTGANHLQFKTLYKYAQATQTETCAQSTKNLQCINGSFTGIDANLYQSATCQDQYRLPCIDVWTNTYYNHLDVIQGYAASFSNTMQSCNALKVNLKCMNGKRSGSNGTRYTTGTQNLLYSGCVDSGVLGCQFTGANGASIALQNGQSGVFYKPATLAGQSCSTGVVSCSNGQLIGQYQIYNNTGCILAQGSGCQFTGGNGNIIPLQNGETETYYGSASVPFGQTCTSGTISCTNGNLVGDYNIYKYGSCTVGAASGCTLPRGSTLPGDGSGMTGYSAQTGTYPHTCENYGARLTCINGVLNGNYATYKYGTCNTGSGWPTGAVDLELKVETPTAPDIIRVAQFSAPQLNISINNIGMYALSGSFTEGFLQCDWQGINIYKSRPITQFVANPMVPQSLSITLKDIFTQSLGSNKHITCTLNSGAQWFKTETNMTNNTRSGDIQVVTADRFDIAMERAIQPIKNNLDAPEVTSALGGAETVKNFVFNKVMDILVPLIIIIGILSAILGFYKMFFSTDDTATQEGIKYIAYGLIGIVIIMSAKFIGTTMFSMLSGSDLSGSVIAQGVYNDLVYPFIKLAMYLVLGVMFIVLVGRVLTFLFGSSDDAKKKAGTIIGRNIIAMLVIIGAKQIVEAIYGKASEVTQPISNLGEIGTGILANKNLPILYHVINRVMGLTSLTILIIIIFQTFQLLMKPDSPEQMKSLKNSLIYIFIGLMVIGAGYLITNFLIVS